MGCDTAFSFLSQGIILQLQCVTSIALDLEMSEIASFVLLVSFLLDEDCFILTGSKVQRVINQHHAKRCLR